MTYLEEMKQDFEIALGDSDIDMAEALIRDLRMKGHDRVANEYQKELENAKGFWEVKADLEQERMQEDDSL